MFEFEYMNCLEKIMKESSEHNREMIEMLVLKFAENIKENHMIHTFGTGHSHMIGEELFRRAGGLGNVNAILDPDVLPSNGANRSGALEKLCGLADIIYDSYPINPGDIMIISSNSGRNSVPIEMALKCKKEGVYTIAVTNVSQSKASSSKHPTGLRLFECCDAVLDTCVPSGDAIVDVEGLSVGPASSIISMFLLNTVITEAVKECSKQGFQAPVLKSRNVDGNNNDEIYARYKDRIKMF